MRIGVLALQGDFAEHVTMLQHMGVEASQVRLPGQLDSLDGLIIPGGESTTIGKQAQDYGLIEPLRRFGEEKAIWGTCAGAIFLSRDARRQQPLLGLMDITVERNAFGRQGDDTGVWMVGEISFIGECNETPSDPCNQLADEFARLVFSDF